jgi:hypothetical protein
MSEALAAAAISAADAGASGGAGAPSGCAFTFFAIDPSDGELEE